MAETTQVQAASIGKLFESLLGRKVIARPGAAVALKTPNAHAVGEFVSAEGELVAVSICDLPLGCNLAAAFSMLPASAAELAVKAGKIEGALAENMHELANILSSVYNRPERPHIHLKQVYLPGVLIAPPLLASIARLSTRIDVELQIAGYAGGKFSFVSR